MASTSIGVSVLAVSASVALLLAGCGGPGQSLPKPATTAPEAAPAPTVAPTRVPLPTPSPSPTRVPPTPTMPPPTPTPTPIPSLALRISATLDPLTPHAGEEFILALMIVDDGERPSHGVYIATSGPWERWTVLDIQPSGTFARDAAGWHIVSPIDIAPGETRTLELHVRADEPSQEQLTFAVREPERGELPPP